MNALDCCDAAHAFHEADISLVPAAEDGTKQPSTSWKLYQAQRPTAAVLDRWFRERGHTGIFVICGAVSGNLEMLEFEDQHTWQVFRDTADAIGLDAVLDRIVAGYCDGSPGGSTHVLYRCAAIGGNTKLARRPKRPEEMKHDQDKTQVLIETRGEGGGVIVSPSNGRVHPTAKPYVRVSGGPSTITTITPEERADLFALARAFDEMPRPEPNATPSTRPGDGTRPGDRFAARTAWPEILEPHGWRRVYGRGQETYWRRPGKDRGVSATTNYAGSDLFYPFTSSTAFEPERSYTKFAADAVLNHGGDFKAAARELAARGYRQPRATTSGSPAGNEGPQTDHLDEASKSTGADQADQKPDGPRLVITSLADVTAKPVDWLWHRWLAKGKFHILAGLMGEGKGTLTAALAAAFSTAGTLPDATPAPMVRVLFVLSEDALDDTLKPRLDVHGADATKIMAIEAVREPDGSDRMVNLSRHQSLIEAAIKQHAIDVVVIDAISDFMSGTDRNAEGDVRDVLTPLAQMADRTKVAILGVMHLGKPSGTNRRLVQMLLGSTAFGAVARVVWATAEIPESGGHRVLEVIKSNLAIKPPPVEWSRAEDAAIVWHGTSEHKVEEIIGASLAKPRDNAEGFLNEVLKDGMRPVSDVMALAKSAGFKEQTIRRAREDMGIKLHKDGFGSGGRWYWMLPTTPDDDPATVVAPKMFTPRDTVNILGDSDDDNDGASAIDVHDSNGEHLSEKPHEMPKMFTRNTGEHLSGTARDDAAGMNAPISKDVHPILRGEHLSNGAADAEGSNTGDPLFDANVADMLTWPPQEIERYRAEVADVPDDDPSKAYDLALLAAIDSHPGRG